MCIVLISQQSSHFLKSALLREGRKRRMLLAKESQQIWEKKEKEE
jgi:hypothetical protein